MLALKLLFPPSLGKPKASARAELLEPALAQELGDRVIVEVAPNYAELERRAMSGEVHLVWAPAAVCAHLEPSARAIFAVVRKGRSTYRSALVARVNEGLSMARLRGRHAVWVDRLSLGGYLLIADHLRSHGIEPDQVFASQRFLGTHPAVLSALLDGNADVGAITVTGDDDAACRDALAMHAGPASKSLVAIAISEAAPTDALVLTSRLGPAEAQRIIEKLFPQGVGRTRSFLCAAMECDGYVRAAPNEYKSILRLLHNDPPQTTPLPPSAVAVGRRSRLSDLPPPMSFPASQAPSSRRLGVSEPPPPVTFTPPPLPTIPTIAPLPAPPSKKPQT